MSNEARYERMRAQIFQLQYQVKQLFQICGVVPAPAPPMPKSEATATGALTQGGASMRNSARVAQAVTRGDQQRSAIPNIPPRKAKEGKTVSSDGTRMSVRVVSPGTPRRTGTVGPGGELVRSPLAAPAAAPPPPPAAAPQLDLNALMAQFSSIGEAVQAALATAAGAAADAVEQALGESQEAEGEAFEGEAVEDAQPEGEPQQAVDPSGENWMQQEGINAGPVVT